MDTNRDHLFDVRVVERSLAQGKITREEYAKYLESLEDCASMADHTTTHIYSSRASSAPVARTEEPSDDDNG
jgi:hypothetical protein